MKAQRRPRVVYWNNIPNPYVAGRFNAVVARGNIDLEVWFSARSASDRSWVLDSADWTFPYRVLPGSSMRIPVDDGYLSRPPLLFRPRPDLLVSLYAAPAFLLGWWMARTAGVRTAFRLLPTYDTWIHRSRVKETIKKSVFPRVDGFKVPGPDGAAVAARYGVPAERIHVVQQSVDVPLFRGGRLAWAPRRDEVRERLGLSGCVFVYVGRLLRLKGIETLLEAYGSVASARQDVGLLIVGDGYDEADLRAMVEARHLQRVVFAGFVQPARLPEMYAAADVFVFPTLGDANGLVIEEAMVSGLPVITSSAAGDVGLRVPEGVAGWIVPPGDASALEARMLAAASDPEIRRRMRAAAIDLGERKTHEQYAWDFERFVESVLCSPRVAAPGTPTR